MSNSVKAVPTAAGCNRWVEAPRVARPAKAGFQEPLVGFLDRCVSVAGIAMREGLTAKRTRPEMAPQELEKAAFAPGIGTARKPWTRKIWYWQRQDRRPQQFPSPLAGWPRQGTARQRRVSVAPPLVARKWRRKSLK